jgi:hypothetical protein
VVDRVYKADLPAKRKALERLRKEFAKLGAPTDWVRWRIDPLLHHARSLERQLTSRRFSAEFSRLKRGVSMFHSDLVYLRSNVRDLEQLLRVEQKRSRRR